MKILHGDCLELLREIESDSIHALVTDPPAGISFMGKDWDSNRGGRDQWIAWMTEVMSACLRVMKPGAHGLVWAIPRTSHWTAMALENAGFEVRDVINHLFGTGFPKSLDISKAIDKAAGVEREVIGSRPLMGGAKTMKGGNFGSRAMNLEIKQEIYNFTAPATDLAKQWQGWGTALKPASEHWILVRKPLAEKTVAKNVEAHGVGGINIDASRIGSNPGYSYPKGAGGSSFGIGKGIDGTRIDPIESTQGRFPANLILSHNEDCKLVGEKKIKATGGDIKSPKTSKAIFGNAEQPNWKAYGNEDGTETVEAWECSEGCAVKMLDEHSATSKTGNRTKNIDYQSQGMFPLGSKLNEYTDSGGASRFFYCAKASKSDRGEGNTHPTVKSSKLMEYLIKLITPFGGIVLDPFMGSGSTGISAIKNNFEFIGIEKENEYVEISKSRMAHLK